MRLIDADALDYELGTSDRDIYVRECLAEAPSVVVEPHWIPCSEKLPTKSDTYLVSSNDNSVFNLYFSTEHGWDGWWNGRIRAWMSLPEPYKGEKNDNI